MRPWATWICWRAILTGAAAIAAGVAVRQLAVPVFEREGVAAQGGWLGATRAVMPFCGLPAVVFGVAGIAVKPLRAPLAVFALISAAVAVGVIVAVLAGSLAPLYDTSGLAP